MAFWTSNKAQIKQKHRFFVTIHNKVLLTVKTITQPKITFENKAYKMLNHEFKYPGIGKWNDVTIKLVDLSGDGDPDETESTANFLTQLINNTGYAAPYNAFGDKIIGRDSETSTLKHLIAFKKGGEGGTARSLSTTEKASTVANSFGSGLTGEADYGSAKALEQNITIWQVSPKGKITEGWTLVNPIVKEVGFGDLSYESVDVVEYELTVQYDWAIHRKDKIGEEYTISLLDTKF